MFGHQDEPQGNQNDNQAAPEPVSDGTLTDAPTYTATDDTTVAPASDAPALLEEQETDGQPAVPTEVPATDRNPVISDDLLSIKQQALQQLTPLVGHLEQSPEERFRTTMMMIQASDNKDLIKLAYEAAQAITDEKTRAQALLDVVNEINYFTQQNQ